MIHQDLTNKVETAVLAILTEYGHECKQQHTSPSLSVAVVALGATLGTVINAISPSLNESSLQLLLDMFLQSFNESFRNSPYEQEDDYQSVNFIQNTSTTKH